MKITTLSTLAFAAFLITASSAQAALTLLINPTTQELSLNGSTFGSPVDNGTSFNPVTFVYNIPSDSNFSPTNYNAQSDNLYTIDRADGNPSLRIASENGKVSFAFLFASAGDLTITGTGNVLNYGTALAGFPPPGDPSPADRIDQLPDGAILGLVDGSGFDSGITVQIVPEPSGMLLSLLGFITLLLRRKT